MRRIDSFVYGHVIGALIAGIVGGAFLDLTAVMVFGSSAAAGAIVSALVCWWWPRFDDAAAWKLWLVATVANPLMLAGAIWSLVNLDCILGLTTGWDCLFSDVGWVVAAGTLPSPLIGLVVRWLWRRRPRPRSPLTAGP